MSENPIRLYPFLFAILAVLNIAARNPGQALPEDLVTVLGAILLACALVYLVAAALLRGRRAGVAALATMLAVAWFYGYPQLAERAEPLLGRATHLILVPVGLVLSALLVWWLGTRPRALARVGTFLTLTGVLLVGWTAVRVVRDEIAGRNALRGSAVAGALGRPIAVRTGWKPSGPRRDVYLILLDEHANTDVLQEDFGFDNRPFDQQLRRRGFLVPRVVRSNYLHTLLSLPSLLNASQLNGLGEELGPHSTDPTVPNYLVAHNRVARFLHSQGYKFIFFPSQWWISTQDSPEADVTFEAWHGWSLERELSRSDLRRSLVKISLIDLLQGDHDVDADHVRRTLAGIAKVPEMKQPTFTFAHVLNPHRPYSFDRHCGPVPRHSDEVGSEERRRAGYVEQVQCIDSLVLQLVDTLLRRSPVPPIILIQGDHGSATLRYSDYPNAAAVPAPAARERFGAFGAYYLPGDRKGSFGDTVTVVNVLGNVLRDYFGAALPRQPDDLYLSLETAPYAFRRIDPRWLAGSERAATKPTR